MSNSPYLKHSYIYFETALKLGNYKSSCFWRILQRIQRTMTFKIIYLILHLRTNKSNPFYVAIRKIQLTEAKSKHGKSMNYNWLKIFPELILKVTKVLQW